MKILLPFMVVILALLFGQSHCSYVNDNTCLACKNIIKFVWNVTHNADEAFYDSLGSFFGRIFSVISPEADRLTHDYIQKLVPPFYGCLNQRVNKDKICSDIDACPYGGDNGISEINAKPSSDPLYCIACIYANDIMKAVFADTPIDMLKYVMGQLCSYMKGFTPQCLKVFNDNFGIMSKFVKEKFVPEKLCQSLKICSSRQTVPFNKHNPISYDPKFDQSPLSHVNDTCLACKNTINFVWKVTHHADEAFYDSLGSFFGRIFSAISPEADRLTHDYVKKLLPPFYGFLNQRVNQDKICSDIDACPHGGDNGISEINAKPSNDPIHCIACIYASDIIRAIFADTPIDMLKYVSGQLCSYMKGYTPECLKIVANNLDVLSKFVKEKYHPKTICQSLKICNKSQTDPLLKDNAVSYNPKSAAELVNVLPFNFPLPKDNQPDSDAECDICHLILKLSELFEEQHPNITDDHIMIYLEDLCAFYLEKTRLICKRIVPKYGRELISIQRNNSDPNDDPCTMVGLCIDPNALLTGNLTSTKSADELVNILPVNFPLPADNQSDSECDICHSLLKLSELLKKQHPNITDDHMMIYFSYLCAFYMEETRLMCKLIVLRYGSELLLIQHINPDPNIDPCAMVGLCTKPNALLNGNLTTTKSPAELINILPANLTLPTDNQPESDECDICYLFKVLAKYLIEQHPEFTDDQRMKYLDFCVLLDPKTRPLCKRIVSQYGRELLLILHNNPDPHDDPCAMVGLCTEPNALLDGNLNTTKSAAELINILPVNLTLPTDNRPESEECDICYPLKGLAKFLLEQHPELTDDQRMKYLDFCLLWDPNTRPLCKRIVSQYGSELLLILHNNPDPHDDPCVMVGLCIDPNALDLSKGNLTTTKPNV